MWEHHVARSFMTGIRADNSSSQTLCKKLGVTASHWINVSCIDKEVFAGPFVTKWCFASSRPLRA
jgi:hypothetical protein